jgi:15-cis-phytoene synthase
MAPPSPQTRAAYEHCEQVTKTQARNFSYGIALLPGDKRRALSAVYALARRIDDIGDGDLPPDDKLAALAQARAQVSELAAELAAGPAAPQADQVLHALADAASRFAIPLAAFGELIDGCEADVRGTAYATFGELEHYCRCVAGSIGRLSLGVFGCADPAAAEPLADALGVALQVTNILRDIREDHASGRVYLPSEDLARFGVALAVGEPWPADTAPLEQLIRFEAERARSWYANGLRLMPMLDWRSAASAGAMAGIYLRLLGHMSATPAEVLARRMSLPTKEKLMVAVRALAGRTPRPPAGAQPAAPSGTWPAAPSGAQRAQPSGAQGAAPSGAQRAQPSGAQGAAPSGAQPAAPSGAQGAAPSGAQRAQPSGAQGAAPSGAQRAQPSGAQGAAPSGAQGAQPSGAQPAQAAGSQPGQPASGRSVPAGDAAGAADGAPAEPKGPADAARPVAGGAP